MPSVHESHKPLNLELKAATLEVTKSVTGDNYLVCAAISCVADTSTITAMFAAEKIERGRNLAAVMEAAGHQRRILKPQPPDSQECDEYAV